MNDLLAALGTVIGLLVLVNLALGLTALASVTVRWLCRTWAAGAEPDRQRAPRRDHA
jgi:hypothetical protein